MSHSSYIHYLCAGRLPGRLPWNCLCPAPALAALGLHFGRVSILESWKLDGSTPALLGLGPWEITALGLSFHICKIKEVRVWEGKSRDPQHSLSSFLSWGSELPFLNLHLLCLSRSAGSSLKHFDINIQQLPEWKCVTSQTNSILWQPEICGTESTYFPLTFSP